MFPTQIVGERIEFNPALAGIVIARQDLADNVVVILTALEHPHSIRGNFQVRIYRPTHHTIEGTYHGLRSSILGFDTVVDRLLAEHHRQLRDEARMRAYVPQDPASHEA